MMVEQFATVHRWSTLHNL